MTLTFVWWPWKYIGFMGWSSRGVRGPDPPGISKCKVMQFLLFLRWHGLKFNFGSPPGKISKVGPPWKQILGFQNLLIFINCPSSRGKHTVWNVPMYNITTIVLYYLWYFGKTQITIFNKSIYNFGIENVTSDTMGQKLHKITKHALTSQHVHKIHWIKHFVSTCN